MASAMSTKTCPCPSSLNVANFVSIKLTQTNSLLWKTQMLGLIESQDMIRFINGELSIPDRRVTDSTMKDASATKEIDNPSYLVWRRSDHLLCGWITGTLSEEVLRLVAGLDTSSEVWNTRLSHFALELQEREREFCLLQQLQLSRKCYLTIPEYVRAFKSICQICKKLNHTAVQCWHRFNQTYQSKRFLRLLAAMTLHDNQDADWFPDTGASAHMTSNPGMLHSPFQYSGSDKIMVGNGDTLNITHVGSTFIGVGSG